MMTAQGNNFSCNNPSHKCYILLYRVNRVTWHQGAIPENKVWLKLGGDKGGTPISTMKMCFQHLNVTNPNAPENTCVFSMFEASDSYTNLKIALSRHTDEINGLENCTWRYKRHVNTFE